MHREMSLMSQVWPLSVRCHGSPERRKRESLIRASNQRVIPIKLKMSDLTGILRDVVQFLESLREAKLPVNLEQVRESLLARSKDSLTTFVSSTRSTSSPEPYLDMNAGSKGLVLAKAESQLEEYIAADDANSHQDYYETFQEVDVPNQTMSCITAVTINETTRNDNAESRLFAIYSNMTANQTKSKCQKCGPLDRKEGKKLFVFEQYRSCWVGLVGSHLLIYGNERDNRPYAVQPIRGYMARAAPTAIPRDQKRSESAFEIFRPGSRTIQFIAKSPSDMEEWVESICRVNSTGDKSEDVSVEDTNPDVEEPERNISVDEERCKEENYQNVVVSSNIEDSIKAVVASSSTIENNVNSGKEGQLGNNVSTAPPLPARIPRKLPSLPTKGSSYQAEDEEDDDIYHKIEDFRDTAKYQNVARCEIKISKKKTVELVSYDDTRRVSEDEGNELSENELGRNEQSAEMTYDDIVNAMGRNNKVSREDRLVSYDDIESLLVKTPTKKRSTEKSDETGKSPQKKSFLDRVRSRRESPRKTEKKVKRKTSTPPSMSSEELSTYDDVSDLLNSSDIKPVEDELPEYNCPPPPRPVFAKPIVTDPSAQDFYDDVSACREKYKEGTNKDTVGQVTSRKQRACGKADADKPVVNENSESCEEGEHYQTPRKDMCRHNQICIEQEDLYDDIAILADFTARRRSVIAKKDTEESKLSASPEKKSWNRFASIRKTKSAEPTGTDTNTRSGPEEADELNEHQGLMRMKTFQRLISKMENSLGKTATRTTTSPFNKTNISNNM